MMKTSLTALSLKVVVRGLNISLSMPGKDNALQNIAT